MGLRHKLLSQSALVFAVRIAGAGLVFVIQALMARLWGAETLGQYLLVIAVANLLAVVMPLGFQTIGSLFAAEYAARADGQSLRRFLVSAYGHIVLAGVPLVLLAGYFAPQLGAAGAQLALLLPQVFVLAAGTAVIYVNGAVLVGLNRPLAGFFADTIFRPLVVAASFAIVLATQSGAAAIGPFMWLMAVSYGLVAAVHFAVTLRAAGAVPKSGAATIDYGRWWRFALPWVIISLASDFFFDLDLILLATMLDHEQIAIFGICTRIFVLASFGVMAVYSISIPGLMADEAQSNVAGQIDKIADANLAAAGMFLLLFAGVAGGGLFVLRFFGPGFESGWVPLMLLTLALGVRAVFGPASLLLSARNHPHASLPAIAVGILVLIGGNFVLVPQFGLTGAAIAALLAMTAGAAGLWFTALRLTGLDVSIIPALARLGRALVPGLR